MVGHSLIDIGLQILQVLQKVLFESMEYVSVLFRIQGNLKGSENLKGVNF
jgi:hypothetical protein